MSDTPNPSLAGDAPEIDEVELSALDAFLNYEGPNGRAPMNFEDEVQSTTTISGTSDSVEDDTEEGRARKRRREFAHNLCAQLGLEADALDDFANLTPEEQSITLYAYQKRNDSLTMKKEAKTRATTDKLLQNKWRSLCYMIILNPNLLSFANVASSVISFARHNPGLFNLTEIMLLDAQTMKEFDKQIKSMCANIKTNVKQAVENGVVQEWSVPLILCTTKAPLDVLLTPLHCARLSILRRVFDLWADEEKRNLLANAKAEAAAKAAGKKRPREPTFNARDVWAFVDKHIKNQEQSFRQAADGDLTLYKAARDRFITTMLKKDMVWFPVLEKVPAEAKGVDNNAFRALSKKLESFVNDSSLTLASLSALDPKLNESQSRVQTLFVD